MAGQLLSFIKTGMLLAIDELQSAIVRVEVAYPHAHPHCAFSKGIAYCSSLIV